MSAHSELVLTPVATGTLAAQSAPVDNSAVVRGNDPRLAVFHVEAYGAKGNGQDDDAAAFTAAITACPAGGTVVATGSRTYLVGSTVTVSKAVTIDLAGATVKKSSSMNAVAVTVAAGGACLRRLTVDGARSDGAGNGGIEFAANSSIPIRCEDVTVKSTGKSGFVVDTYSTQAVEFYRCASRDNLDSAHAKNAHGFAVTTGTARLHGCVAEGNDGNGIFLATSAAAGCLLVDPCARRNTSAGIRIQNTAGCGQISGSAWVSDNRQFGLYIGSTKWDVASVLADMNGTATGGTYVDGTGASSSGTSVELSGASRCRISAIIARGHPGYGLALFNSTLNDFGTVVCDQTDGDDGDPGVQLLSGSSGNTFGHTVVRNHTYGIVVGDSGASGSCDDNLFSEVYAHTCTYGAVAIQQGAHNHVGMVVSRDSYTTSSTFSGLVDFSSESTTGNVVGFVDHRTVAAQSKPTYLLHFDASASDNVVRAYSVSSSDVGTAAVLDTNGGNTAG